MSLDLTPGAGNLLDEFYWEILSPWRGESLILNTGPAPRSGAAGSTLWSILEEHLHQRYFLTRKACQGILRRAYERGKPLPEQLKIALEIQAGTRDPNEKRSQNVAFHINQRDEGIDLNGVSGALMATRNMQMQTFITQPEMEDDTPIAFAANQRAEVRDLHDVACALGAQPRMKHQTFIVADPPPDVLCLNDQGDQFMACTENITGTLRAQMNHHQPLILESNQKHAVIREDGVSPTLPASMGMGGGYVPMVYENHGIDSRYTGPHEVSPTISARCGTGGNNVPLVEQDAVFCIMGNAIDREPENGGNGIGYHEDVAYTLTATDRHAICDTTYQHVVGALCRGDEKGVSSQYVSQDKCIVEGPNLIRRLTPLECERLQGFPDGWTNIPSASDSARYKALGNSVAMPCVEFVMQGIALILRYENEIRRRRRLWICFRKPQRCAA